jgi:hypothetical protein
MEKYLIYYNETSTSKKYIETIYRNSTSTDTDMGDAIEFDDKETALKVADYLNKRDSVSKYKVMCIKTTIEEVVE